MISLWFSWKFCFHWALDRIFQILCINLEHIYKFHILNNYKCSKTHQIFVKLIPEWLLNIKASPSGQTLLLTQEFNPMKFQFRTILEKRQTEKLPMSSSQEQITMITRTSGLPMLLIKAKWAIHTKIRGLFWQITK